MQKLVNLLDLVYWQFHKLTHFTEQSLNRYDLCLVKVAFSNAHYLRYLFYYLGLVGFVGINANFFEYFLCISPLVIVSMPCIDQGISCAQAYPLRCIRAHRPLSPR